MPPVVPVVPVAEKMVDVFKDDFSTGKRDGSAGGVALVANVLANRISRVAKGAVEATVDLSHGSLEMMRDVKGASMGLLHQATHPVSTVKGIAHAAYQSWENDPYQAIG